MKKQTNKNQLYTVLARVLLGALLVVPPVLSATQTAAYNAQQRAQKVTENQPVGVKKECQTPSTDLEYLQCNGYKMRTRIVLRDCYTHGGQIPMSSYSNCYLTDAQYAKFKKDALAQGRKFTPLELHFNENTQ